MVVPSPRSTRPDSSEDPLAPLRLEVSRLRNEQHLSYDTLAERSGLGRITVIRLETGGTKGELTTWLALAKGLGVPLSDLLRVLE